MVPSSSFAHSAYSSTHPLNVRNPPASTSLMAPTFHSAVIRHGHSQLMPRPPYSPALALLLPLPLMSSHQLILLNQSRTSGNQIEPRVQFTVLSKVQSLPN
uniref:Secreted protein n=2 Tax=Steinernema glaseri TaxID=37863 RepID=A0A1I8ACQ0_9BILA